LVCAFINAVSTMCLSILSRIPFWLNPWVS
jgi:hypothetical protein